MASPRAHRMFGPLAVPVIAAPMFLVSTPELVIAACKAGVIGAIPAANARSPQEFARWIERVAAELEAFEGNTGRKAAPFAVNIPVHAPDEQSRAVLEANLEICRRYRPGLIITVFGNPAPVVDVAREWGGKVVHDVTNIRHAKKAIAAGVDGLVLIASGGGGHSGTLNPFVFVSEVRRIFDGLVVLAGGMADGAAVLAAEALGADLCYMGTRFIATQESGAGDDYKRMIVEAGSGDVIYTPAFSHGVPAMMLRASIARWGYDPDNLSPAEEQGVLSPAVKPWKDIWAAGQSVALIEDVPPVETLVARIVDEYARARHRLNMGTPATWGACA